jgi:hypothetical protein
LLLAAAMAVYLLVLTLLTQSQDEADLGSFGVASRIRRRAGGVIQEGKQGLEPGSIDVLGIELDSGGKHSRLMESLKAFSLAFSCLNLAFSCLSCKISFSICTVSFSISFVLSLLRSIAIRLAFIRCSC